MMRRGIGSDKYDSECDVTLHFFKETEKAILVGETDDEDGSFWLPKSQLSSISHQGSSIAIILPRWLARKHDL